MIKCILRKIKAKIVYRYLWSIKREYRLYIARRQRRKLWKLHSTEAVYKPCPSDNHAGWSGRWEFKGVILCWVDELGEKHF